MDYLNADFPVDLNGLSEAQLRREVELRRSVHMLRTNAANCVRGLVTFEPVEMLLPETIGLYFNEMMNAAKSRPRELARVLLLEQAIISKHLISHLAVEAIESGSTEVTSAYATSIARLQAEFRRNVKSLAEMPVIESRQEVGSELLTEADMLAKVVELSAETSPGTGLSEDQENVASSELSSKQPSGRTERTAETQEPSPGRSRPAEPTTTPRNHGYGPPTASGVSLTEPAVAQGHRPVHASRKVTGRPKRTSRQDRVEAGDQAIALIREAAARKYAEVADRFAQS